VIAWATYYALFSGPHYPQVPKSKIPPPVVITLARSNAPLRVASGAGTVMSLHSAPTIPSGNGAGAGLSALQILPNKSTHIPNGYPSSLMASPLWLSRRTGRCGVGAALQAL